MPLIEDQPINYDKLSGLQSIDPRDLPPNVVIPHLYHRFEDVQPQLREKTFLARGVVIGDPNIPNQISADSLLVDCLPTKPVTCRADYDKLLDQAHDRLTNPDFYRFVRQFGLDSTRLDCQYFFQEEFGKENGLNIIALKTPSGFHFEVWDPINSVYGSITGEPGNWISFGFLPNNPGFPDKLETVYSAISNTDPSDSKYGTLLEIVTQFSDRTQTLEMAVVQKRQIPNPGLLRGFTYHDRLRIMYDPESITNCFINPELVVRADIDFLLYGARVKLPEQPYVLIINADTLSSEDYRGQNYKISWGDLRGIIFATSNKVRNLVLLGHAGLGIIQYGLHRQLPVISLYSKPTLSTINKLIGIPIMDLDYNPSADCYLVKEAKESS